MQDTKKPAGAGLFEASDEIRQLLHLRRSRRGVLRSETEDSDDDTDDQIEPIRGLVSSEDRSENEVRLEEAEDSQNNIDDTDGLQSVGGSRLSCESKKNYTDDYVDEAREPVSGDEADRRLCEESPHASDDKDDAKYPS